MTIAHILGRGGAGPATVRRRRARVAAVIAVLCLAAGCSDPEFGEPDPQTMRDVEKCGIEKPAPGLVAPPGSYVAQGLTIDYARVRHDGGYSGKILADPRMLEQVYVDAASGNVPARWTVCLYEATSRGAARQSAKNLAGLRCQTIARCSFQPGQLKYSDATASGMRMLTLIADDFEAEARRQQVTQEILGHVLTLFVSTRVLSARVRAGPAATGSRPASKRPTSKQGGSPPAMRELTGEELSRVRGGSPTRRRPVAAGLAKPAPRPAYRSFTRANFRHNLTRRTGGIPDNAQAHHVLPVKYEPHCSKAGINIHHPKFGTWWRRRAHQKKARAYNDQWRRFFDKNKNPTSDEILQFGRALAQEYGLAIGF